MKRPSQLAGLLFASTCLCSTSLLAQDATPESSALDMISVSASSDVQEASGGQVTDGATLGILGDQKTLEAPYSIQGYTSKLAEDQQARTLADVVINDPSVSLALPRSSYRDAFRIRGFSFSSYDTLFNGLPGMTPNQRILPQNYERIEVLKGPNSFLNGYALGGSIGGAINVVPKRAEDTETRDLTVGFASDAQASAHMDWGRRFKEGAFGVRTNLTLQGGDLPIDGQSEDIGSLAVALDYKGERIRASLDLNYQQTDYNQPDWYYSLASGANVPDAPSASANLSYPWAHYETQDMAAIAGIEYDITESWTGFARLGFENSETEGIYAAPTKLQENGDFNVTGYSFPSGNVGRVMEAGLKGYLDTGPIGHQVVIAATRDDRWIASTRSSALTTGRSNLYSASSVPSPASGSSIDLDDLNDTARNRYTSLVLADTMSMFDDRLLLTFGGRHQRIETENYARSTKYDDEKFSPSIGIVWRAIPTVSLYANYAESLQSGPTAPMAASNYGEIFAPFAAEQIEVGVKYEGENWGGNLSLYEIRQPSGIMDATTLVYAMDGEQTNRGLELSVHGELFEGLRVLGGLTFIDSELTKTAGGSYDGNRPVGTPEFQTSLGVEWDVPVVSGLTLTSRALHVGSQFVDQANSQELPDWTRYDVGLRYVWNRGARSPVIFRASVENVLDLDYWASASSGMTSGISRGAPRTFLLNTTIQF